MGLAIGWNLTLPGSHSSLEARGRVEELRRRALELPFLHVFEMESLRGDGLAAARERGWVWGDKYFAVPRADGGGTSRREEHASATATEMIHFVVHPGRGAESANFGVARHPATSFHNGVEVPVPDHHLWSGRACCKTQYAGNPRFGGEESFLRSHVGLIALLDSAKDLGFGVEVGDDGSYWDERDPEKLVAELRRWNTIVARFAGAFGDALGERDDGVLMSPIRDRADFERVEAGSAMRPPVVSDPLVVGLLRRTRAKGLETRRY